MREFLIQSLKDLGLNPETQQGYILNEKYGRMTQPVNIVAKLKGTESGKALLVFSHYDSAGIPSFGASDAGSGVVTILESLRAFNASGKQPKNDIIILFTDAEEVGLVGAKLFVREHRWAKDVGLFLYSKFQKKETTANIFVAPLFLWLIINIVLAVYLKGAAYLILPYYCALVSFWILIKKETSSALMHLLLVTPAILMFSPLIQILPVGLGLETIVLSTVLTVLIFGLLLSFLSTFAYNKRASIGFMFTALCLFIFAHATSDFNEDRKKPNSLLYMKDLDAKKAYWLTYDSILDDWTKTYIGSDPKESSTLFNSATRSKYNSSYTFAAEAPHYDIPHYLATTSHDTLIGDQRKVSLKFLAEKKADVLQLYVDQEIIFSSLSYNSVSVTENLSYTKKNNRLLTFSVQGLDSLEFSHTLPKGINPTFTLHEYSFDLMDNPWMEVSPRTNDMMPKPFVFTDTLITIQKITPTSSVLE